MGNLARAIRELAAVQREKVAHFFFRLVSGTMQIHVSTTLFNKAASLVSRQPHSLGRLFS